MSSVNLRSYVDILDGLVKKLDDFLLACDTIVPWFRRIRGILESLGECSRKLNAMRNRNHDFGQIGSDGMKYFESFMHLMRVSVVFDVGLKLGMTQCNPPIYLSHLEKITEALRQWNYNPNNYQVLNELKTFAIEYGLLDEDNYDGTKAKTEDLLKLLNGVEAKLSQIENLDEPLGFVSIMEMKRFTSKIMTIQPKAVYELPRESIMHEIANLIIRTVTLANNIPFKTESNSGIVYISQYRLLSKRKFERCGLFEVSPYNSFEQLAPHLLHFKTRSWLLGKIETWLVTTDKPFYYVVGSEGVGKSCLVSAFCKLYDHYIINTYVFDSRHPSGVAQLIKSIASSLMHNFPEYLCLMDDLIPENQPAQCPPNASWQELYQFLLKNPFNLLYGNYKKFPKRKLIVVEGLNECTRSEWNDLAKFMDMFRRDFSYWLCMLVTCRTESMTSFPYLYERDQEFNSLVDGVNLDSKTWTGLHLTDLEMFTTSCFCDVIARRISPQELTHGDNFRGFTKSLDNFLKHSAGKFSYAQHLLRLFDESMVEMHGQFHKSVIDAFERFTAQIGRDKMDENLKVFAKVFYNYRLNEGNPVQPPPEIFLIMAGKGGILE